MPPTGETRFAAAPVAAAFVELPALNVAEAEVVVGVAVIVLSVEGELVAVMLES